MKTKILLLTALAAAIVYSCTSDREDEVQQPTLNKVALKPLKTNKSGETSRSGDSIAIPMQNSVPGSGIDPQDPVDPNGTEIVHPGDVKPPKP